MTSGASPNLVPVYCFFHTDLSLGNHNLHMWERPHQHFTQHTGRERWNPAVQQTLNACSD